MTLFGITSIITFFTSIGFALVVYSGNRKSSINRAWLLLSVFIAFWSIFLFKVISSNTNDQAMFWQYFLDVTAIFIPFLYLNFIFKFLKIKNQKLWWMIFIASFLLAIFSFFNLFKTGVEKTFDFYWINPGKFYFIFPYFFIVVIIISLIYLIKEYFKKDQNIIQKRQIQNQILAGVIGFGGGLTNFFPQLFNIYPFGNYFIILYVFFVSYAVLKYQFFNTKIISTQLFTGALSLIFLFNLLKPADSATDWFINFFIFVMIIIFVTLLNKGIYKELESKREIEKLAESLKIANIRLKKLDKQKSEFVSIASHQLRSPIASLKGYSSMVLEGSYGRVSGDIKDVMEKVYQSSQSLSLIIDDFLNLSRIERGKIKYNFTKANVKKYVEEALSQTIPLAKDKGLKVKIKLEKGNYQANIDGEKIRQIITNIIDNAIKYTNKGFVEINLSEKNKKILIKISDSGIGISKNQLHKLFKKFSRLENANQANTKGTGLGLYLAKQITEAHNGKIWAESEGKNKGSSFFVELKAS